MVQTVEDSQATSADAEQRTRVILETRARRSQAEALLRSLVEAKSECERQLERFRRSDAMQSVTGRTAIDKAIASTKRMIESLDRALQSSPGTEAGRGPRAVVISRA